MNITELQDILQNFKINITAREIAQIWQMNEQSFSKKKKLGTEIKYKNIKQLEEALNIKLISNNTKNQSKKDKINANCVKVFLKKDANSISDKKDFVYLDKSLFSTDRIKTNPNNCEIFVISGNSMSPEYKDGDRVIIDKSIKSFTDGHIFAFKYNGKSFIKEICLTGTKIKAIPLNKEYESFFIDPKEDIEIFGKILPRVRL